MFEIYRIESVSPQAEGSKIVRHIYVRTATLAAAKERALAVFRRARRPQALGPEIEMVRVIDGAGYEVFSIGAQD
jgi:hypothetical protein